MPGEFACPFSRCISSYSRKSKLREHLLKQKTLLDENHRATEQDTWDQVERDGMLVTHTRPKNLTVEEKAARSKGSTGRWYAKHREQCLQKQRQTRQKQREALMAASKLTTIHKAKSAQVEALQTVTGSTSVVATLYDKRPTLSEWIGRDITFSTFPRFVAYLYPPNAWPVIEIKRGDEMLEGNEDPLPFFSALPSKNLYKKMSKRFHPDKHSSAIPNALAIQTRQTEQSAENREDEEENSSAEENTIGDPDLLIPPWAQATLNAGWRLWEPYLEDPKLKECELFDATTEDEFCAISEKHANLVRLYWEWVDVTYKAKERLVPKNLSLFDVERSFVTDRTVANRINN
jgi:hypothetical protein